MTIFLDKQRPPKKRMGRKQRKGSKSNPGSGVQWANWLDDPSGAPGGGGPAGPPPVLSSYSFPGAVEGNAWINTLVATISLVGSKFEDGSKVIVIPPSGAEQVFAGTYAPPFTLTASNWTPTLTDPHQFVVENPDGRRSNAVTFKIRQWPRPSLTLVTPNTSVAGADVPVVATGTAFQPGILLNADGKEWPTTFVSATECHATFNFPTAGSETVGARHPDGGYSQTSKTFTVT